ncbi:MAG: ABC transporter ATP-binding protein [Christensenellaceae bacterium]|jgi:zinc transport system ATP-binding protein|nr:ABC transporter ATP-binding protein [Christensenellaceae bacterium]
MLLEVKDVSACYDGKEVVSGVNFTLDAGDYLCIVGENGSGKSTLLKIILGLMRHYTGHVHFPMNRKLRVGYLPQQTQVSKDFPASVFETVLSGCVNRRPKLLFYNKSDKALADENLKKLGIFDLKRKAYNELSFGQQRRVLIARALCATDELLVLDEPVNGLDPMTTRELYKLISELNTSGMTIIMISHDIENSVSYANKILHMSTFSAFFGLTEKYIETEYYLSNTRSMRSDIINNG